MSTYREIIGKKIKKVSSDPSDGLDGEMWYNSTTGTLRGLALVEAWSSGADLGTAAYQAGSFGTHTAGVRVGGVAGGSKMSNVEHYNGTGWSNATAFPAAIATGSGAGTQTAGLIMGGKSPSITSNAFKYNGTSWTAANSLPATANNIASCGLAQNNVIGAIGQNASSGNSGTNTTVTFDGTNFASGPNINVTRMFNTTSGAGTGTAGLIMGGFIDPSPNNMTNCEEYDGSSWSNTDTLSSGTGFATAWGTQTNAVTQVNSPNYAGSEAYNGTTWSALPDIGITSPGGLYGISAGATGDAGWLSSLSDTFNKTAEFNRSVNTITAGAWASGGAYPSATYTAGGAGTQTAGLGFGGNAPGGVTNTTFTYDGSTWSSVPATLGTARYCLGGTGTQTAALAAGGEIPGTPYASDVTDEYNGTSWAPGGSLATARRGLGLTGIQTAALAFGGDPGSAPNLTDATEEYGGTSWTTGGTLNTARNFLNGAGTQTASVAFGGANPGVTASTEEYNGSSWTAGNNMITARYRLGGAGTQTDALAFGGGTTPQSALTEGYDGTNWSTRPSMGTARSFFGDFGIATAAVCFGGDAPGKSALTEEFTGETSAANIETFTTS